MTDAREVTETLLSNRTVVLNFEGLDVDVAQRIIDVTLGHLLRHWRKSQEGFPASIFIVTPEKCGHFRGSAGYLKRCHRYSFGVQQQALRMMTKEEQQLEKRFLELGEQAWQRGTAVYSDFLNLNELNIFQEVRPKLPPS